ncbi:MAG TPA: hypothetical protein VIA18_07825, partial [Polyangia bacterium]|nr:hypothetical protein [Polyangia bacterium]
MASHISSSDPVLDGTSGSEADTARAIGRPLTDELVGAAMDVGAVKELEEALAFRDLAMGIVGHDLRSPLSAILVLAELARFDANLTPTTIEKLSVIERSARR